MSQQVHFHEGGSRGIQGLLKLSITSKWLYSRNFQGGIMGLKFKISRTFLETLDYCRLRDMHKERLMSNGLRRLQTPCYSTPLRCEIGVCLNSSLAHNHRLEKAPGHGPWKLRFRAMILRTGPIDPRMCSWTLCGNSRPCSVSLAVYGL